MTVCGDNSGISIAAPIGSRCGLGVGKLDFLRIMMQMPDKPPLWLFYIDSGVTMLLPLGRAHRQDIVCHYFHVPVPCLYYQGNRRPI